MSDGFTDVTSPVVERAASLVDGIRAKNPRIHCITNTVAQAYTANMLLAAGATPSVTTSPEEIAGFVGGADNLLVNLGTLDAERREGIGLALDVAAAKNLSWVLDPVFVDRSPLRLAFARGLIARGPAVIRLNAAELAALSGAEATAETARAFARASGSVVALTGEADIVTDGARLVRLRNGDPLMGKVTAMGCAGSAFVAAALACEGDRWLAAAAAMTVFGVAGEVAAKGVQGPGSLAVAILDTLHAISPENVAQHAKVSA
jgi:hydroxyethylthiazole kinase